MKFNSKTISISDEEFGCALTFSENRNISAVDPNITLDELVQLLGQYFILSRTYGAKDADGRPIEPDSLYMETPDPQKSGELDNFVINLSRTHFSISGNNGSVEITMEADDLKFAEIKKILHKISDQKGQFNFE